MISREEVLHVARLARLHFDEEELPRLQAELSRIIDYVQRLSELDLTGVSATSHVIGVENVFREDEPRPCLSREQALANAPDVEEGQFAVPRMG